MGFWSSFVETLVEIAPHLVEIAKSIIGKVNDGHDLPEIEIEDLKFSITNLCSKIESFHPGVTQEMLNLINQERLSDVSYQVVNRLGDVHKEMLKLEMWKAIEAIFDDDADEAMPSDKIQSLVADVTPSVIFFPGTSLKIQVQDAKIRTDSLEIYQQGIDYLESFYDNVNPESVMFQIGLVAKPDCFAPDLHRDYGDFRVTDRDHIFNKEFTNMFGLEPGCTVLDLLLSKKGGFDHYGSTSMAIIILPKPDKFLDMVTIASQDIAKFAPEQKNKYWHEMINADPSILADLQYYASSYMDERLRRGLPCLIKMMKALRGCHYFASSSCDGCLLGRNCFRIQNYK
jgi:hypothetical protein